MTPTAFRAALAEITEGSGYLAEVAALLRDLDGRLREVETRVGGLDDPVAPAPPPRTAESIPWAEAERATPDLAAMRAAAETALVPGHRWEYDEVGGTGVWISETESVCDIIRAVDGRHIAAWSPSNALAVLDILDRLRAEVGDPATVVAALALTAAAEHDESLDATARRVIAERDRAIADNAALRAEVELLRGRLVVAERDGKVRGG